jgi:V/A-type H+-transporting ATPase subunit I
VETTDAAEHRQAALPRPAHLCGRGPDRGVLGALGPATLEFAGDRRHCAHERLAWQALALAAQHEHGRENDHDRAHDREEDRRDPAASIVWGVLISSYFGLKFAPTSFVSEISPTHYLIERKADYHFSKKDDVYKFWLAKFPKISQAKSGPEMLEIASVTKNKVTSYPIVDEFFSNIILEIILIIGILHISFGLLRYIRNNIAGLGWIIFLVGGYFFFPSILKATVIPEFMGWMTKPFTTALGLQCLYVGVIFAALASLIQHGLKGLGELAHLVQIVADVLSYLRLYALSLAGAIMATTFNQEGTALNLFLGFITILLGHAVNMLLAMGGGVIHGLRLNFIEWYHYCFIGGGKLFKPLHKLKIRG